MSEVEREAVRAILDAENLDHFNWFEDRYLKAYEAGIQKVNSGWRVYGTDERAAALYDKVHAEEGTALAKFLDLARHNMRRHWDDDYKRYEKQLLRDWKGRRNQST